MELKGKKSYMELEYSSSPSPGELGSNSYSFNGPCSKSINPEMKRMKRIASYNLLATEEKLKATLRNSFKWLKNKLGGYDYGL